MKIFKLPRQRFAELYPDDDGVVIAEIHPAEFLRLASYRPDEPGEFDHGLIGSWEDWPKLLIDPEERICFGHEGRHRIAALLNAGYDSHAEPAQI